MAQGIDPQNHLKERQEEQSATFLSVANRWKEKRAKEVEPLTMKKNWDRLEKYLFPIIGHYSVDKITSPLLIDTFKPLNDKGYK